MQTVGVQLPHGIAVCHRQYVLIHDCKIETEAVRVVSSASKRKITLHTTTFRDKVTPGDRETVTLRVEGFDGALPESAVMLDMSNKAIDVIQENPFGFTANQLAWNVARPDLPAISIQTGCRCLPNG